MNNNDIVAAVASRTGLTASASEAAVKAVLEAVRDHVAAEGRLALAGFGTFEVRDRAARNGRNPRTGEAITIPARRVPVFRPARAFREQVAR